MARKNETGMSGYGRLFPYIAAHRSGLIVTLLLTAAASLTTALQPWPLKLLADYALGGAELPGWIASRLDEPGSATSRQTLILLAAAAAVAVFAVGAALDAALTWVWSATGQRMMHDLAVDLFARMQRLSLLFHGRQPMGESLSRLTTDIWCVQTAAEGLVIGPARCLMTLTVVGAVAWQLSPSLTLTSLAAAPLLACSAWALGGRLKRHARQSRIAQTRVMGFVHQTLATIPLVQVFDAGKRNRRHFSVLAEDAVKAAARSAAFAGAYRMANVGLIAVGAAVVLYAGGRLVLAGRMTVGSLLVFLAYLATMKGAFQGLLDSYEKLKSAEASLERVTEVLASEEEVPEPLTPVSLPPLPKGRCGSIRMHGVTFGYEAGRPVLKGIDFEAHPGEKIALVGPSGAGKSTLAALVLRLFDPWDGRVCLDGLDVRRLSLADLRSQIAIVPQEALLLPVTVAENIAYGRPHATRSEVEAAALTAGADEFIRRMPQGYDTPLGDRGSGLSGGERQRLAIARALLKDAPVVIFDEPTSALDATTERAFLDGLERLGEGRTTLIITHRLSTARRADRVLLLNEGAIVATGTHEELLAEHELYRRLFAAGTRQVLKESSP